jgi:hypothetical protein
MEYAEIKQRIDCVFGDDHQITVKVNEDGTLGTVFSTCSADKAETEGLIHLGTDPMKTCLGYMDCFIKHVDGEINPYSLPSVYQNTVLCNIGGPLKQKVEAKRGLRLRAKQDAEAKEAAASVEGLIARKLREYMGRHIGNRNEAFAIRQEDNGRYTFNLVTETRYNSTSRTHVPTSFKPIADRVDGDWVVRYDWDDGGNIFVVTGRYGGWCEPCGKHGRSGHDETPGHIRNMTKVAFIGMQATSKEGMRLHKDNVCDKEGNPVTFTYRKNTKKLVGVRFGEYVVPETEENTYSSY